MLVSGVRCPLSDDQHTVVGHLGGFIAWAHFSTKFTYNVFFSALTCMVSDPVIDESTMINWKIVKNWHEKNAGVSEVLKSICGTRFIFRAFVIHKILIFVVPLSGHKRLYEPCRMPSSIGHTDIYRPI